MLLALLALPTGLIAHERAVDIGLSTQELGELARATAVAARRSRPSSPRSGRSILVALQRRLPRLWWVAGTAIVIAYAVLSTWLAPVVLAPIFNDFQELPPGPARTAVLGLADRAGVEVGHVYEVDASRRSTGVNAYVDGIGSSRRIVLYDNLLDRADGPVLRAVVAHELAHVAHDDLPRGLLFVAIIAPLGMLLVALRRHGPGAAWRHPSRHPGGDPGLRVSDRGRHFGLNLAGNQLSRRVEASADRFALELTHDPRGFIELQQRLVEANQERSGPIRRRRRGAANAPDRGGADRCGACLCGGARDRRQANRRSPPRADVVGGPC